MEIPSIETFERNIEEEIKNKQASISDIASNNININKKEKISDPDNRIKITILAILSLILLIVIGIFTLAYLYLNKNTTQTAITKQQTNEVVVKPILELNSILPLASQSISRFISSVKKVDNGYILNISSFSPVFSYITKNEYVFGNELQKLFKITNSSSNSSFKDVTISNQDMRILSIGEENIVYAFIENKGLALSTSTEGILTIRSVILSQ